MARRYYAGGVDVTDAVRAHVDAAPPLSPAQRDQLAALFSGAFSRITAPTPPAMPAVAEPLPTAA